MNQCFAKHSPVRSPLLLFPTLWQTAAPTEELKMYNIVLNWKDSFHSFILLLTGQLSVTSFTLNFWFAKKNQNGFALWHLTMCNYSHRVSSRKRAQLNWSVQTLIEIKDENYDDKAILFTFHLGKWTYVAEGCSWYDKHLLLYNFLECITVSKTIANWNVLTIWVPWWKKTLKLKPLWHRFTLLPK